RSVRVSLKSLRCGPAPAVGKDAAFGAELAAVRGILAHLFPPREGLGSSPRPSPAPPRQGPARPQTPRAPVPLRRQRPPPPPTLGNGGGQNYWHRASSRSTPSTGIRCGARKRWPPSLDDHQRGADGILKGAVSVAGATALCAPTMRQVYASLDRVSPGHAASVRLLIGSIVSHLITDHNLRTSPPT